MENHSQTATHIALPHEIPRKLTHFASNAEISLKSPEKKPGFVQKPGDFQAESAKFARKLEENNFFRESLLLSPEKRGNFEENAAFSRGNSQISRVSREKVARKSHFVKDDVDIFKVKDEKSRKPAKLQAIERFFDSSGVQFLITCLIFYALFGMDLKFAFFQAETDEIFDYFTIFALSIFLCEILVSILVKDGYFCTFFFWLDVLSTVTLVLDLSAVDEVMFGGSNSQISRANKSTKIGTRAGRIIRILRLFRLIRIIKIWKSFKTFMSKLEKLVRSRRKSHENPQLLDELPKIHPLPLRTVQTFKQSFKSPLTLSARSPDSSAFARKSSAFSLKFSDKAQKIEQDERLLKDIRVGRKLSDLTTQRVSILAMLLIFAVPLFDSAYYSDNDKAYVFGLKVLLRESERAPINLTDLSTFTTNYVEEHKDQDFPLIFLSLPSTNFTFQQSPLEISLRFGEKERLELSSDRFPNEFFTAVISVRSQSRANATLSLLRTITLSLILGLGAYLFTKDSRDLALKPIARMIEKVNKIASNPLCTKELQLQHDGLETSAIENAIIKIGTLLALGFGDAGAEIIAKNVSQGGDVDPMLPGVKQFAVFGFCDIRNFTDSTEVLQEDVMLFVNRIAHIVHKTVDKYAGVANKNIGDAFLLLWKFEQEDVERTDGGCLRVKRTLQTKNLADFAVISFLKILCGINCRREILQYRDLKALKARIPDYKVKMGFGLHVGWAIEGAIGSVYKIDASYLSPNVNIASRLEAATKQYGVSLLISHELFGCCSKRVQRFCREIDRVTVKGSLLPLGLFTVDAEVEGLEEKEEKGLTKQEAKERHVFRKNNIFQQFFASFGSLSEGNQQQTLKASMFFEFDANLAKITRNSFGVDRNLFQKGFQNYIEGKWKESREGFEQTLVFSNADGPTLTLLNFMRSHGFEKPSNWQGFRELVEK